MGGDVRDVRQPSSTPVRRSRGRIAGFLAVLIRIVGWLFVLVLVAHIVLSLGDANPANGITTFVAYWADRLLLGFDNLFIPADERVRIAVNYGLAALFWLIVSSILARLVRRIGG